MSGSESILVKLLVTRPTTDFKEGWDCKSLRPKLVHLPGTITRVGAVMTVYWVRAGRLEREGSKCHFPSLLSNIGSSSNSEEILLILGEENDRVTTFSLLERTEESTCTCVWVYDPSREDYLNVLTLTTFRGVGRLFFRLNLRTDDYPTPPPHLEKCKDETCYVPRPTIPHSICVEEEVPWINKPL